MDTSMSFEGSFSLLLTPFTENGQIDWQAYQHYVEWQVSLKPSGLFAVCGTSEMKWLETDERLALARQAARLSPGLPVLATANLSENPGHHKDEVLAMCETGVSGIVLVPPDGMGTDPSRLEEYFLELTSICDIPFFIYEWPQVSPYRIPDQVFSALVQRRAIRGIKDTTCTLDGIKAKIQVAEHTPGTVVYQANMPFMVEAMDRGANGIMTVASGCFGDLVTRLWNERQSQKARNVIHDRLIYLDALLRLGYPKTSKFLLQARGLDFGLTTRWPSELTDEVVKALALFVKNTKKLESNPI